MTYMPQPRRRGYLAREAEAMARAETSIFDCPEDVRLARAAGLAAAEAAWREQEDAERRAKDRPIFDLADAIAAKFVERLPEIIAALDERGGHAKLRHRLMELAARPAPPVP